MALTITDLTSATSNTSTSTLVVSGITASVGDWLVLAVAADNNGTSGVSSTSTSITDASGNTWVNRSQTNWTPTNAAADGNTLTIWTCQVTTAFSSASITVNFSPNTAAKAAIMQKVSPGAGEAVDYDSVGPGVTGSGTTYSSGNVSVTIGYAIFGFLALEGTGATGDSDTTNGSWSTQQQAQAVVGGTTINQEINGQHKVVTGTGNQSYDPTRGLTRDYALNYLILKPVAVAYTLTADVASFTETGQSAVLAVGLPASTGNFSLGGQSAVLAVTVPAAQVAFTLSGQAAALHAARRLTAAPATFLYLGADVSADAFAIPLWPDALPRPTIAGYALKLAAASRRVAMDQGAARVYRRARPLPEVTVAWQLSNWQQMLLDGFYHSIVDSGAQWFRATLALPVGLAAVVVRFKEAPPSRVAGGLRWAAGATLELQTRPMLTDAQLTALIGEPGEDGSTAWPSAYLPKPLASSWELHPQPELLRSDDMPGLPRARQRRRTRLTQIPGARWSLTADQAAIFDAFFHHRGKDGAQWFDFPMYAGIGTVTARARFLGDMAWMPRAGDPPGWTVEAGLEVREREVLSAAGYAELVDEDPDALFEVVERVSGLADVFIES